ncbi:chaplin family protein [Streptomyces sp. NPDC056580]|uniref:chaplin family protein n=1 Tax=Streptomyces sp. NPDC056580 TaxID=3345872 RepID=UPI0036BE5DC2
MLSGNVVQIPIDIPVNACAGQRAPPGGGFRRCLSALNCVIRSGMQGGLVCDLFSPDQV